MDTAQWPEGNINGVVKIPPMETNPSGAAHINKPNNTTAPTRAQKPQASNCPRCNSGHTKFCYYNNYSLSQPRYFCKTCRRYWTEGGSLRNVPVGGGSRKNKRSSSSSSSFLSKNIKLLPQDQTNPQNPNKILIHEAQDLNLAYPPTGPIYNSGSSFSEFVEFPSTNTTTSSHHISELLKYGINGGRGFTSFMSMIPVVSDSNNNPGLHNFQDFSKPSGVNFSLDHHHGGFESLEGVQQENGSSNSHAKLFFPFEDLKQQPTLNSSSATNSTHELMENSGITQGDHHQSTGYWNGSELGGGGGSW